MSLKISKIPLQIKSILSLIFFILSFSHSSLVLSGGSSTNYVEGEILITFNTGISDDEISVFESNFNLTLLNKVPHLGLYRYKHLSNISTEQIVNNIHHSPIINSIDFNHLNKSQLIPTDPSYNKQWYLHNTGQLVNGFSGAADVDINWPEAIDIFSGVNDVIVAVIDSGVSLDHPDIFPNHWINNGEISSNSIDDDGNGFIDDIVGWDFIDNDSLPLDTKGHGSLVASIIASQMNNGEGVVGISPNVKIMALRTCSSNGCPSFAFIAASTYAANNGAKIINYSVGGPSYNSADVAQIKWLEQQGILFVTAAGNGGDDSIGDNTDTTPNYPSSYTTENIISVAAINRGNNLASFSNFGKISVDIAAPGTSIYGADIRSITSYSEDFESGGTGWTQGQETGSQSSLTWSLYVDGYNDTWLTDSVDVNFSAIDYVLNTNSWTKTPSISLGFSPRLEFTAWHQIEYIYDNLFIEISTDNINWNFLDRVTGNSSSACPSCSIFAGSIYSVDLSDYENQTVYIRFRFNSDSSNNSDGIYIDDIKIKEVGVFSYDGTQYQYNDGTSFSAPVVTGVAALLMSQRPDLTYKHIKQIILNSAKQVPALTGQVLSNGTINALTAIQTAINFNTGILAFDSTSTAVNENNNFVNVTVSRTNGSDGVISVQYTTSNGSGTSPQDYISASGTLTFADGETSKTIMITIVDDTLVESNETINLTLSSVIGASLGAQTDTIITINDDDVQTNSSTNSTSGTGSTTSGGGGGGLDLISIFILFCFASIRHRFVQS